MNQNIAEYQSVNDQLNSSAESTAELKFYEEIEQAIIEQDP